MYKQLKRQLRLTEKLIDEEGIDLEDEDGADFDELNEARSYFQNIFGTNKYNKLNDERRMRWQPLMI